MDIFDQPQGVVFDAVGTLIYPKPKVAEAYAEAARRQGVAIAHGEVRERFERAFAQDESDELRGPMATDESVEVRRWRRIVAEVLPGLPDPDRAFEELWEHFADARSWRTFDEVGPALRAFRDRGFALAVASNFDRRLRGVLKGLPELSDLADSVVISSEVGYRKPHPAFYRAILGVVGLPAERVLYVGDDLENDFEGPRRAGFRAALIPRSAGASRPVEHPVFADLSSLVEHLRVSGRP